MKFLQKTGEKLEAIQAYMTIQKGASPRTLLRVAIAEKSILPIKYRNISSISLLSIMILALIVLLLMPTQLQTASAASKSTSKTPGYDMVQLTKNNYDSCFLQVPISSNPVFGSSRGWGDGTAWASCSDLGLGIGGKVPKTFSYSFLNSSTGNVEAKKLDKLHGLPSGNVALGPWFYRGDIAFAATNGTIFDTGAGAVGNNTEYLYGFDTTTESSVKVSIPLHGSPNLACPQDNTSQCNYPSDISGTYVSLSGSSAVVTLGYTLAVPAQNFTHTWGDGSKFQYSIPAQYSTELLQLYDNAWVPYSTVLGPSPSEHTVQTLSCTAVQSVANDPNLEYYTFNYQVLEQSELPTAVVSSGYSGFAYSRTTYSFEQPPATCNLFLWLWIPQDGIPWPLADPTSTDLVVANLNVGNLDHVVKSFDPSPGDYLNREAPAGVTTCDEQPPCFAGIQWMSGNLLSYEESVGNSGSYWLFDALHGTDRQIPSLQINQQSDTTNFHHPVSKSSDGSSLIWTEGNITYLWNGQLGILENFTTTTNHGYNFGWVDGEWAAWTSPAFKGDANQISFYDLYNSTVAYLEHPKIYTVDASTGSTGYIALRSLSDFNNGTAVWVSLDAASDGSFVYNLHWYNVTLASEGKPASSELSLGWVKYTASGMINDLLLTHDWVYLSATANMTDTTSGGNHSQIYAIKLPSSVIATGPSGQEVNLGMSGNITASQILSATLQPGKDNTTSKVSIVIHGTEGTVGTATVLIPKNAVPGGLSQQVYINGTVASKQSYTQDANNYYVTFTTHFSTETVDIAFSQGNQTPSSEVATTGAAQTDTSRTGLPTGIAPIPSQYLVPAAVVAVAVIGGVLYVARKSKRI